MRSAVMLLIAVLCFASGCKQYATLSPLADADNPVYDDQLLGRWYGMQEEEDPQSGEKVQVPNTEGHFTFTKYGITGYKLSAVNMKKETTIEFEVYPFDVGDHAFLQLQRTEFETNEQNAGILRVYYFVPYKIEDDKLYIQFASTDKLKKLATEAEISLAETDQLVLLTGGRRQTLDFLKEHMDQLYPPGKKPTPLHRAESLDLDLADES